MLKNSTLHWHTRLEVDFTSASVVSCSQNFTSRACCPNFIDCSSLYTCSRCKLLKICSSRIISSSRIVRLSSVRPDSRSFFFITSHDVAIATNGFFNTKTSEREREYDYERERENVALVHRTPPLLSEIFNKRECEYERENVALGHRIF